MAALAALAWMLPPSLALVACAWVWLQRERDHKLNDETMILVHSSCESIAQLTAEGRDINKRLSEAEAHIGRLTDRSLR